MRKIAVITGANRGLGRSTALRLARAGTDIVGTYCSHAAEADDLAREIGELGGRAVIMQLDLSKSANIEAFVRDFPRRIVEAFGRDTFDFLVNNAGIALHASFAETTEAQVDEIFAVHVKGPFFLTQALLPMMVDGGRIINVSSGLTRFTLPGFAAYAMVKGAIDVLTRYMAQEFGERRITANVIAPGAIDTNFGGGRDPYLKAVIASTISLGRIGQPDEVGSMVGALLSDDNGWVNGTRIEISGGQNL